jgi:ubiquinone/menaquinone biosynthesis C-methylase UbiE
MIPLLAPLRRSNPYTLYVRMIDVRMGDRIAQIGCAHGGRLAATAGKVGLSGRAVAVVFDESSAERARKGASVAGVLIELIEVERAARVPLDDDGCDLVIVDETGGLLTESTPEDRSALIKDVKRILRPGGRVMVVGTAPRGGLGALLTRAPQGRPFNPEPWLQADGFKAVRRLAEREHLVFVEALKPRQENG